MSTPERQRSWRARLRRNPPGKRDDDRQEHPPEAPDADSAIGRRRGRRQLTAEHKTERAPAPDESRLDAHRTGYARIEATLNGAEEDERNGLRAHRHPGYRSAGRNDRVLPSSCIKGVTLDHKKVRQAVAASGSHQEPLAASHQGVALGRHGREAARSWSVLSLWRLPVRA